MKPPYLRLVTDKPIPRSTPELPPADGHIMLRVDGNVRFRQLIDGLTSQGLALSNCGEANTLRVHQAIDILQEKKR